MNTRIIIIIIFLTINNLSFSQTNKDSTATQDSSNEIVIKLSEPLKIENINREKLDGFDWDKQMPWIAALIVGLLSVLANFIIAKQLRLTNLKNLERQIEHAKEIALTEFKATIATKNRQDWINELRHTISEFMSYAVYLMPVEGAAKISDQDNVYEKFTYSKAKIEMLTNSEKPNQKKLLDAIEDVLDLILLDAKDFDLDKFNDSRNDVINAARKVFDLHWKKIKNLK